MRQPDSANAAAVSRRAVNRRTAPLAAVAVAAIAAACAVRAQPAPAAASRVIEAQISPDGQSVAYTRSRAAAGREEGSLWRIPYGGGQSVQLVADRLVAQLRWTRDSRQIGFVVAGQTSRVMVVSAMGGNVTEAGPAAVDLLPLTTSQPSVPAPSAESKVLFQDAVGTGQQSFTLTNGRETWIDLLAPATGERVTVMPPGMATVLTPPSWSADGKRFVVVGENSEHGPEVIAGALPLTPSGRPDFVGAPPPQIRRLTFSNP